MGALGRCPSGTFSLTGGDADTGRPRGPVHCARPERVAPQAGLWPTAGGDGWGRTAGRGVSVAPAVPVGGGGWQPGGTRLCWHGHCWATWCWGSPPPRSPGHRGSLGPKRSPLGEAHGGCQPRPEGAARDHERMPGLSRPLEVLLDFTFPSSPAVVRAGPGEGGCPAAREEPGARVLGTADSETEAAAPCCFGGPLGRMELESE